MGNYDYLEKLYAFANENGFKVKNLNVNERSNQRGRYDFVELALIIPRLNTVINEQKQSSKKEVNSDEI